VLGPSCQVLGQSASSLSRLRNSIGGILCFEDIVGLDLRRAGRTRRCICPACLRHPRRLARPRPHPSTTRATYSSATDGGSGRDRSAATRCWRRSDA